VPSTSSTLRGSRGARSPRLPRARRGAPQGTTERSAFANGDTGNGRLLIATLNIKMAPGTWTQAFTQAHPEIHLEVLNRSDVNADVSVSDYWIPGGPPGTWAREIRGYRNVLKVDALAEVGEGSLYRITDRNPPIVYLYRRLGLPLQFPMRMQGGSIRWEVVAREDAFRRIFAHARKTDPGFQVVSIRRRPLRSHLPILTDSQHELLARAMAEGYFAVPRGITLTELARRLNRSKSSVSEAIAHIERKLLDSALRPPALRT
jgi:DNA-binding transcriptional LysR family regulator